MAKHDEGAAGSPLAQALNAPLEAGSLEAALHAARTFFMRHAGDGDAKRVVEALELLMAQVWLCGAEQGQEPDARHVEAAHHLAAVDLRRALASYEALAEERGPQAESAKRLALCVRTVMAACAGEPLPSPESIAVPPAPVFEEMTRVANVGELPLAAFDIDDVTASYDAVTLAAPDPNRPPRAWGPQAHALFHESWDDERTRVHEANALQAGWGDHEVTRVADAGELPLEQLCGSDMDGHTESAMRVHAAQEHAAAPSFGLDGTTAAGAGDPRDEGAVPARPPDELTVSKPPAGPTVPPPPVFVGASASVPTSVRGGPGHDELVELGEPSWAGVRVYEAPPATFEPEAAPVEADTWGEPTDAARTSPEHLAEELVARGELGEALRIYQDLASSRPDDSQLWERVAEIARLLRQRTR